MKKKLKTLLMFFICLEVIPCGLVHFIFDAFGLGEV